MKIFVKGLYIIIGVLILVYLSLPSGSFPEMIPESLQSNEPGDTESNLRRAYFTNYERDETRNHYLSKFKIFNNRLRTSYVLNYPPEDAQIFIREQTRSSYLEEIVNPLRESLFINGFFAKEKKDEIIIDNRVWVQKVTVRYIQSNTLIRIMVFSLSWGLLGLIVREWTSEFKGY